MKPAQLFIIAIALLVSPLLHAHSGGTDKQGCHGGSATRHCHTPTPKASPTSDNQRTCVYIYRYTDGSNAYIGISNDPTRRWKEHSRDGKPFASLPVSVQSCYPSRREALQVERRLIKQHCRPQLHNKTYCHK